MLEEKNHFQLGWAFLLTDEGKWVQLDDSVLASMHGETLGFIPSTLCRSQGLYCCEETP